MLLRFLTSCFLLLAACASQASKTDLSPRASCSFGSSLLASCCLRLSGLQNGPLGFSIIASCSLLLVISPLTRSFCCKRGRRIFYTPRSRIGAWRLKRNEIEQNMAKHIAKTRKTFLEGHVGHLGHPGHTWHCKEEHQRLANRTLGVVEEMIGIRTVFDLQEHFLQLFAISSIISSICSMVCEVCKNNCRLLQSLSLTLQNFVAESV